MGYKHPKYYPLWKWIGINSFTKRITYLTYKSYFYININFFCNACHCSNFYHPPRPFLLLFLDFLLSQYSYLYFIIKYFKLQFILVFVIIEKLISLIICTKSARSSSDLSPTSTLHKSITAMDSYDTTDNSGRNLMH